MILAGTIKCTIPSDNAIKLRELYCTVAYPVSSADSQTWATWASAVAAWAGIALTIALAYFAWRAWKESQSANELIKKQLSQSEQALEKELAQSKSSLQAQLESSESGLQTQIDSALSLSMRERELEQLQAYSESLLSFINNCAAVDDPNDHANAKFQQQKGETTIRWASWSMYMMASDIDFRNATSVLHSHYMEEAENIQALALDFHRAAKNESTTGHRLNLIAAISHNQTLIFNAVGLYVAKLQYIAVQAKDFDIHRWEVLDDAKTVSSRKAESDE